MRRSIRTLFCALAITAGCSAPPPSNLAHRAYIVSKNSDEVHVIDLDRLQIIGVVRTKGLAQHMGELSRDLTRLFVDSELSNETEVVDVEKLTVVDRLVTPRHPTHITATRDGKYFAIMAEQDNVVLMVEQATHKIAATIPGFFLPHFMRMSLDGRYGYVANLRANHVTRVDLESFAIDGQIPLDGYDVIQDGQELATESGFADVQIDQRTGLLYAAHRGTGRVMIYDTNAKQKLTELTVGANPWIVYAEHPFDTLPRRPVVPSFADKTATVIADQRALAVLPFADSETYGVNYSPLVPDEAFLMNRQKHQIAVVDTQKMTLTDAIDVGGTTEIASTTADGKLIVATVSSANRVVVIDAATHAIVKTFDNVGNYPWSVTIPFGENNCH
jgi:DNA-binding beta-propeller fold protein YncE